jgi:hypothetical protein
MDGTCNDPVIAHVMMTGFVMPFLLGYTLNGLEICKAGAARA